MEDWLYQEIVDAYEELVDTMDDDVSTETLFAMIAEECGCDASVVAEALADYLSRTPILQMFMADDSTIELGISEDIGILMGGEDASDDCEVTAACGIAALSSGIATLAESLEESNDAEDVLELVAESLREAFGNVDFPDIKVSLTLDDDADIELSNGNVLHFPS